MRLALLDPIGDAGIGIYTHELANALAASGVRVDLYTTRVPFARQFARDYRLLPVLGRPLASQRARLRAALRGAPVPPCGRMVMPMAWRRATPAWREHLLSVELATFLARRRYDLVWTQWPTLGTQEGVFRDACRGLGLPLVHTVHNVVPHEPTPAGVHDARRAYAAADALVVHSRAAALALEAFAPGTRRRTLVAPHGLYTVYPRAPEARPQVRQALGIPDTAPVALIFGGIRPYKNVEACLHAVDQLAHPALHLVLCGWEHGMPTPSSTDALAHTRAIADRLPARARMHLLPGPVDAAQAAALFEATDIVLLPYLESWGSGQLLMAMSFGARVIVTRAGGMEEYVAGDPHAVIADGPSPADIRVALARALDRLALAPRRAPRPPALEWPAIAADLLPRLRAQLGLPGAAQATTTHTTRTRRSA